jgi:hypothetical protein
LTILLSQYIIVLSQVKEQEMNSKEEKEIREIYRQLIPDNRNTLLLVARSTITIQENTKKSLKENSQAVKRQYGLDQPPKGAA